eukprot:365747-Chlamydomonas_euryale.AAC.37
MPRSAYGHGRVLSVEQIARAFSSPGSSTETPMDADMAGIPFRRRRTLAARRLSLVARLAFSAARVQQPSAASPALMPAARGRTRRHTVAGIGSRGGTAPSALDGEAPSRYGGGSSELCLVGPVE